MSDYPPPPPSEEGGSTPPPPPPPGGGGYVPPPPPPGGGYTPPPPGGGYPPAGGGYPPQPGYPGAPYGGAPRQNQKALWSLIIGILSIPMGCYACLGWVGIAAIILGGNAKKEIAASMGMQTGDGQAKAGVICGWVGVGLGTLVLIINLALFATGEGSFDYNNL